MSQIYTNVGFGCARRFADLRGPTSRVTSPLNDLEIGPSRNALLRHRISPELMSLSYRTRA
jgi:hypothetical protein